ncbi:MAG TPA: hypothetical protein VJZ71_03445 [Phycisphaerae bacterium]|nr:hypothetical protein [Phycisphaerae bacterium]
MNLGKTHLENCGWQSVAIHQDHVMLPRLRADDRGWTPVPFSVGYLAPQLIAGGDDFARAFFNETPAR